jgi:hypothetical protein
MWDLWWTKGRWGRFSPSISVFPANLHSTTVSTITITYHPGLVQWVSSGRSTQSPIPQIKKKVRNSLSAGRRFFLIALPPYSPLTEHNNLVL